MTLKEICKEGQILLSRQEHLSNVGYMYPLQTGLEPQQLVSVLNDGCIGFVSISLVVTYSLNLIFLLFQISKNSLENLQNGEYFPLKILCKR